MKSGKGKHRKKYNLFLAAITAVMVLSASIGTAWAYFSASVSADGAASIHLGDQTTLEESFDSWTKHVSITSTEDSQDVFLRVKAFAGADYALSYIGSEWTPGPDDYYYYNKILSAGETAETLDVIIDGVPEGTVVDENFNVVVIYETTPVTYDANGAPAAPVNADWSRLLNTGDTDQGTEGGGQS